MAVRMISGLCSNFTGSVVFSGAISGTAFFVCYCGYKTFQWAKGNDETALDKWSQHTRHRIFTTFKYLAGSLSLTTGIAVLASKSAPITYLTTCESDWVYVGVGSAIIGTWLVCKYVPYKPYFFSKKHFALALHCGVVGSVLALINSVGIPALVSAGVCTAIIVTGYVTYATVDTYCCSPEKIFLPWIWYLRISLCVVFGSVLGIHFASPDSRLRPICGSILFNGCLALPPAYLLYDTQKLITAVEDTPVDAPFDPINAQMNLFMDGLLIFALCIVFIEANKE